MTKEKIEKEIREKIIEDIRPWGKFRQYTSNEISTVKILTVDSNQVLSKQSHKHRDELWVVMDDGLQVELDDKIIKPVRGEEIVIPRGTVHRLGSLGNRGQVMEVSFGYFDEDDIERFDDIYGRDKSGGS